MSKARLYLSDNSTLRYFGSNDVTMAEVLPSFFPSPLTSEKTLNSKVIVFSW